MSDPATTLTLFIQPGEKNTGPSGMSREQDDLSNSTTFEGALPKWWRANDYE